MAILVLLAASFLFLLFLLRSMMFGRREKKRIPPGSFGWPLIGETIEFLQCQRENKSWAFVEERYAKYGPVFKTSLIGSPVVVLPVPVGTKFLFSNEGKLVENSWPSSVGRVLGEQSLAVKRGEEYKRSRQFVMKFLKPEALQKFVGKFSKLSEQHLNEYWNSRDDVYVFKLMKKFTFSLTCAVFLSLYDKEQQEELAAPFHDFLGGLLQLPLNFPGTRYRKALNGRERLLKLFDGHISRRRRDLAAGLFTEEQDLLSVLLSSKDQDGNPISEEEIKDNILLLLFAGHDTSSSALTVIIKFLAENPYWMDKLYQEQREIIPTNGELQWEDTKKMNWTWRVVQESLRLQPPVQGGFREAVTDIEYEGFHIPKGWKIYWTATSHRNDKFFSEANKFDPSRFEGSGVAPYTWIPFGGGGRMCPGYEFAKMEMLVFIHHLVMRYRWTMLDLDEEITVDPMPFPKKGLHIKLERR